jgi:hypothetical protein
MTHFSLPLTLIIKTNYSKYMDVAHHMGFEKGTFSPVVLINSKIVFTLIY